MILHLHLPFTPSTVTPLALLFFHLIYTKTVTINMSFRLKDFTIVAVYIRVRTTTISPVTHYPHVT